MYLWQIRQFLNNRHNRHSRNPLFIYRILCILLFLTSGAAARSESPADAPDAKSDSAESAQETFRKSLATVVMRQSIQAKLQELVQIGEQPLRMTGLYQEHGGKTRLELQVRLMGDAKGSLLEVSDGEILWSQTEFRDTKQVTLRNLKQIAAALAEQPDSRQPGGPPELGLGGLSGLMNSLDRTMQFDQLREETDGDVKLLVVQGKWKPDYVSRLKKNPDDELPAYIPDMLRIYFDAETLFPRRFLYLKRLPEKTTYRPIVRLEFQDVQLDQPVDDAAFQYTPPEDLVPDDITKQYIDQLKGGNAPPSTNAQPADKTPQNLRVK